MIEFSPDKMREINDDLMAQITTSFKRQKEFSAFMKSYNDKVRRMHKFCAKSLKPEIPELKLAESALWMWIPQLNIKKSIQENNRVWKDEFFRTDPSTDYNN